MTSHLVQEVCQASESAFHRSRASQDCALLYLKRQTISYSLGLSDTQCVIRVHHSGAERVLLIPAGFGQYE